ncbi:MAG: hypothetical protein ACYDG3_05340 [Bacillati bacterium]
MVERLRVRLAVRSVVHCSLLTRESLDPPSPAPGRKRGEANAEHHRRNREWTREEGEGKRPPRDRAWFLREVMPKLNAFPLTEIAHAEALAKEGLE